MLVEPLGDVCDVSDLTVSWSGVDEPPLALRSSLPVLRGRAADLVVVRESSESDHILMAGCIDHTLSYCTDLPGYEVAKEVGISLLLDPGLQLPGVSSVVVLRHRRTKAVLFAVGPTYFFYSEASAAKSNSAGENNFTTMLVAVLEALRPHRLHVVAVTRLVRSFEHAGLVQSAVTRTVDEVIHGGVSIRMSGQGQEMGQLMWSTLAAISASERNFIVQRLSAGVVAKFRRGQWTVGVHSQPIGYPMDAGSKALVLDGSQRELVARVWTMLADPGVAPWKLTQVLGDLGVSTHRARSRHGAHATVADLKAPVQFMRHMLRYADLYATGVHVQRLANPFPGATQVSSLPVLPGTERYPDGYVEFVYDLGVPAGGWVDPAIIRRALEVRQGQPVRRGVSTRRRVLPLSGSEWIAGGLVFRLAAGNDDTYQIRAQPLPESADGAGGGGER